MWLKSFATITHSRAFILCRTSPIKFLTEKSLLRDFKGHDLSIRLKYVQHKGVKGIRNKKRAYESLSRDANEEKTSMTKDFGKGGNHDESINLNDSAYEELVKNVMNISPTFLTQNVFIIQPYVKWGGERNTLSTPEDQLEEAKVLIDSLPDWHVGHAIKIPLETLNRKTLFGSGKIEELKKLLQRLNTKETLTCLFISKSTLSVAQKSFLEETFKLPVLDRYSIVIQILRLHATSAEARLQVAMAEIPYLWAQMKDANPSQARKQGYLCTDVQRDILKTRERKLKHELERIRDHRRLLRNKRKQKNYPVIAVVGYTNTGKTSLIKALTQEQSMQPRNQLFATLDVTAHGGILPCNLEVIYMDTVGFMSDLPTGLMECFVATLEDAMLAVRIPSDNYHCPLTNIAKVRIKFSFEQDVILHVQDQSHRCKEAQMQHVVATLQSLKNTMAVTHKIPPIINVGNKIDLMSSQGHPEPHKDIFYVSATEGTGLMELTLEIERQILTLTGRRKVTMRVRNGGPEVTWLYKNTAVKNVRADDSSAEHLLITVVIDELTMQQFKREFLSANYQQT